MKFKSPYAILLEKFDLNPELFKENPYLKLRGLNNADNLVHLYHNRNLEPLDMSKIDHKLILING
ncbi:MAG: hypothetical protein KN64_00560 [Sulfurovum sp. AS07-7]|nr:MAG: hypothetical protein KN64_00560 [Sulfurovum sp. AS07-7]